MAVLRNATRDDFRHFIALAREVEPLFGPMAGEPAFQRAVGQAMDEGRVFCLAPGAGGGVLRGAVVVDAAANAVAWLAVAERFRGREIATRLLGHALERLDRTRPVRVTTFAERTPEALAARRLYGKYGFVEVEPGETNPAGYPTVILERRVP